MNFRHFWGLGLLFLLTCSSLAFGEDEKIDLHLKLSAGQIIVQRIETAYAIIQEFPGKNYEVSESIRYEIVQEVLNVDKDGIANVRCTCRSVLFKRQNPHETIEYNSSDRLKQAPPEATGFVVLVGTPLDIRLSSKGEVLEVKGADELLGKMLQQYAATEGPARESIKRVFSRGNIKEMLDQTAGIYPKTPVGVGDIWAETDVFHRYFPITVNSYFKLLERSNGKAVITIKATIKSDPHDEPVKAGPMLLRYDLSGQLTGNVQIVESTGLTVHAEMSQQFSGTVLADGVPGANPHMSWPISIESSVRVEDISP